MKKGFTLAEILVTLAAIGIVASVTIPMLSGARPNSEQTMLKKAYATVNRIVIELMQSTTAYPKFDQSGFRSRGGSSFRSMFKSKLNVTEYNTDLTQFYTSDGMLWTVPNHDWATDMVITVDVNGGSSGTNCKEGGDNCPLPDTFDIGITNDGHVYVIGNIAKAYLRSSRNN